MTASMRVLKRVIANFVAVAVLGLAGVGEARASFLKFDFAGTLWNVNENIESIVPFAVGTPFSGNFTWDEANSVYSFTWNIDGSVFQTSGTPDVIIDNGTFDAFQVYTYPFPPSLPSGWSTSGGEIPFIQFYLRDDSGTVFSSTSLPASLNLSDFDQTSIGFYYSASPESPATLTTPLGEVTSYPGSNIAFQGRIESITNCYPFPGGGSTGGCFPGPGPFPAPEPGTLALLVLGLAGVAFTRRRKH